MKNSFATVGEILLSVGFVLGVVALVMFESTPGPDANIGAGLVLLLSLPCGTLGLVFLAVSAVQRIAARRTSRGVQR